MKKTLRTIVVDEIEYKWMINRYSFRIWLNKKEVYRINEYEGTMTPKRVAEIIGDLECHWDEQNMRTGSLR